MKEKFKSILIFSIVFVVFDQIIKIILSNRMILNQSIVLIKNFLSLTLLHNTGAAFNIFNDSRYFLIIIGILAIIGIIFYIRKLDVIDEVDTFVYALLIGGIVGNLLDRIIYGYVIDYLSFNIFGYYFPVFNFADMCIVIAIFILVIKTIKESLWK